ncbi:MAG: type II secretion system F family protein [Candidatus Scatovivens sp.]
MPKFEYRALSEQGQIVKNKVVETSKSACIKKIKRNGMTPISVKQIVEVNISKNKQDLGQRKNIKSKEQLQQEKEFSQMISKRRTQNDDLSKKLNSAVNFNNVLNTKVSSRDIRIFTQDFYLLKKANFNNIHALQTVISSTESPTLRTILEDVLAGVEAGEFMYTTLEYYSSVFPYIYINMIKVGELSGTLEDSLEQAIKYLEDKDKLGRKIRRILLPNIFMFFALIIGTIVAVVVGVPIVQDMFESMGATESLPAITLWFAGICTKLLNYWYIDLLVIGLIAGAIIYWINTPYGRYKFDQFKYTMPVFGKLIYSLDFSRLMQGVYLNMQNGMRIQDALEVSKNVVKNTVMVSTVEAAINNIYTGDSWIEPFENSNFASPMMVEMLKIGMQTDLTEMLAKLIEYIEIDIDNTLERIVKVLPEFSYLFVGIVLIFFTLVVLVPIIQIYMGGWMFDAYGV